MTFTLTFDILNSSNCLNSLLARPIQENALERSHMKPLKNNNIYLLHPSHNWSYYGAVGNSNCLSIIELIPKVLNNSRTTFRHFGNFFKYALHLLSTCTVFSYSVVWLCRSAPSDCIAIYILVSVVVAQWLACSSQVNTKSSARRSISSERFPRLIRSLNYVRASTLCPYRFKTWTLINVRETRAITFAILQRYIWIPSSHI